MIRTRDGERGIRMEEKLRGRGSLAEDKEQRRGERKRKGARTVERKGKQAGIKPVER